MYEVSDQQVCALRELALARQAYAIAMSEFSKAIGCPSVVAAPRSAAVDAALSELLAVKEPREFVAEDVIAFRTILQERRPALHVAPAAA